MNKISDGPRRQLRRLMARLLTSASALSLLASAAAANPQGGSVAAGSATIIEAPGNLEIRQSSDKTIINWQSFSIGPAERTHFAQPAPSAIALNRVTGGEPSQILGRLSATGQIVLVNPNGVLFGVGATIDVAGLVATTSGIRDSDFMAGRMQFRQPGRTGATVVNRGTMTVRDGGLAALVAPGVENSGQIVARFGNVTLASGDQFTVDLFGDGLINLTLDDSSVPLDAADGGTLAARVSNSGRITADGGRVLLTAATARNIVDRAINMDGIVEARSFVQDGGRITLLGGDTGEVHVAGVLDSSGENTAGGAIDVFGEAIVLAGGARLDASGDTAGGAIRIGGDYRGQPSVPSSTVQAGATIHADARREADGGRIIIWSDGTTSFYGTASARGGASGGNGGFVEVSGKQQLAFTGRVDTRAVNGHTGQLLLDPTSIEICSGCTSGGNGTPNSQLNANDLIANLNTGNVTVTTESGAAGDGDIDVNARLRWSSGNDLTLSADRDINIQQNIEARAQSDITLEAGRGGAGDVNMSASRQLTTIGGNVDVSGTQVTLQRITTRASGAVANGGDVTVQAGSTATLSQQIDARGSNPLAGTGGTISIVAAGDIIADAGIDSSGYAGDAGHITLRSDNGSVTTGNSATLNARGLRGGNGGTVTLQAENGTVHVGTTNGTGTRIATRSLRAGPIGNGGNIVLRGRAVEVNRDINASGGANGSGGNITVTATAGAVTTRKVVTRGGTTTGDGGDISISAAGDIDLTHNIDTAAYAGTAGRISLSSTAGNIATNDTAALRAQGLRGGDGGSVTIAAADGTITLGATDSRGTRIDTRGLGTNATGDGGDVRLEARAITLNRDIDTRGSVGGDGGNVTLTATAGDATTRNINGRGGTVAGHGGAVQVRASNNITANSSIDVSGYTGNSGSIALTSTGASIATADAASLSARGLRGGDGGRVTLSAANGDITIGTTGNNNTRILTSARGSGSAGTGGDIALRARAITLNRNISANGAPGGNAGNIAVTATADNATTRTIVARGGRSAGTGGSIVVSAARDVAVTGNLDVSAYLENAGRINIVSDNGAIATTDNAIVRAQGLAGGNGGTVTFSASAGTIALGATVGAGTRIDTRGRGTGSTGAGGNVELTAGAIALNRAINANGSVGGNAGNVTATASAGNVRLSSITARGGTAAGQGGAISVNSVGSIDVENGIDASASAGGGGGINLLSQNGSIAASDNAVLNARSNNGGDGGTVALSAIGGAVSLGATAANGTRVDTRSRGAGSTGAGGAVTVTAGTVTLNRDINANGGQAGNGGRVSVTASNGDVTMRNVRSLGGSVAGQSGEIVVAATGAVTTTSRTLRGGNARITSGGAINAAIVTDALTIGGGGATIVGTINGQSSGAAVNELQIINTNIPNPCTVNGIACILPPPPPPPETAIAAPRLTMDPNALSAAIDQAGSPLPLRVADQETPAHEAFVQSPLIDAVSPNVFSGGYQLIRTPTITPAGGGEGEQHAPSDENEDEEQLDPIVPSSGRSADPAPTAPVDAYFTQDLWSGLRNQ